MASSHVFFKVINTVLPFTDFVYILQMEDYSSRRLIKWLPRFFFRRNIQHREHLVLTSRAFLVLVGAVGVWGAGLVALWILMPTVPALIGTALWCMGIPLIVLFANTALYPVFAFAHARLRRRAAARIASFRKNCTIVLVAGSYGKTTTKNFIEQCARYNYRVQVPPGNVNTSAGIANWILKSLHTSTTLLIIETDGYSQKEFAETVAMVPGDIALITNVGDQHLERFGSKEKLAEALGEVFALSEPEAHLVCTSETKEQLPPRAFGARPTTVVNPTAPLTYKAELLVAPDLSDSNKINLRFALAVVEQLDVPVSFVQDTLQKLTLPDRRQKESTMYGFQAIDDSYNISWSTAQAGVATAKKAALKASKKLLVITAGIMELSPTNQDKNKKLGQLLAREAHHTVVLGSMFADEVISGMGNTQKYTRVPHLTAFITETHKQFSTDEWFLLVQSEMHDLYY